MKKFVITVNGQPYDVEVEEVKAVKSSKPSTTQSVSAAQASAPKAASEPAKSVSGSSKVNSPMPGSILKIHVNKGDVVKRGQSLLVLEAMKMENDIKAPADGKVIDVKVKQGDSVTLGQILVEVA